MKIANIMITDLIQIWPDDTVGEAAKRMREQSVGCLVATTEGAVKGIITDRDLLGCLHQRHDPYRCKITGHMSRPVVVLRPEEEPSTGIEVMRKRRIKRLPVIDSGRLLGIVSLSDLVAVACHDIKSLWPLFALINDLLRTQSQHITARTTAPGSKTQTAEYSQPSPEESQRGLAIKQSA